MQTYTPENTLALAKRWKNTKRPYLLVNPLQAKHLPVRPAEALEMMECLGRKAAERFPEAKLVIGFAETATAIGAVVAGCLGEDCVCIQTTREEIPEVSDWVFFREEHSHAVEQKLCGEHLGEWLAQSPQILLVDDELSTGKTVLNVVKQLRAAYPAMEGKTVAAVSLLNRLGEEHLERLREAGIRCEWLVKLPHEDLSAQVADYAVTAPETADGTGCKSWTELHPLDVYPDLRRGVPIGQYARRCTETAEAVAVMLAQELPEGEGLLVLGTEECMYPALVLGALLEKYGIPVRCHATTRSPIGICRKDGYPIQSGECLRSLYEAGRQTFVYNLRGYPNAILVTDRTGGGPEGAADLAYALKRHGCGRVFLVEGGGYVQHLS